MMSILDMAIVAGILIAVTGAGHVLTRRHVNNVSDFFRGGNNMPWWAVSGSIIATKISALTFVALPAMVFVDGGDLRMLMAIGGFVLGNVLMGVLFVGPYYKDSVYSPYDFIGNRIHTDVAALSRLLFLIGTVLSQSVRLLATAIVLQVISGMPMEACVVLIAVFSVLWSVLGGIQTVIWTDLMLFFIFLVGGLVTLLVAYYGADTTFAEAVRSLDEQAKLKMLNLSLDPRVKFTLWAGLIGAAAFELGSNAIDQVVTQRIICCRSDSQARTAVIMSAFSVVPTVLMLGVGLALVLFFDRVGIPAAAAGEMALNEPGNDKVFPYFVANHVPTGLSGLILAGIFASGITTLDSALTALSQSTVVGLNKTLDGVDPQIKSRLLNRSRRFVMLWGVVIVIMSISLFYLTKDGGEGLLTIGLTVPGYVYGSLLGLAFLALCRRASRLSAIIGTAAGCLVTLLASYVGVGFFWWYPVAAVTTFAIGSLPMGKV